MKVYELAEKLGTTNEETIKLLEDIGVKSLTKETVVDKEIVKTFLELSEEIEEEKRKAETKNEKDIKSKTSSSDSAQSKKQANDTEKDSTVGINVSQEDSASLVSDENESSDDDLRMVEIKDENISVRVLAEKIDVSISELIKEGLQMGLMLTLNQEIDIELAMELAQKFNVLIDYEKKSVSQTRVIEDIKEEKFDEKDLKSRPPIVTIMGHVDHGKTKLLDVIRKSNVMDKEAGGITQHIGAYQVEIHEKKITFIDTPGHEAFTTLRARGAQITDIVIIVVAADDGIMPQTIEAIDHAKVAKVPIIVAINKIDKPEINIDRVKQQLVEHDLTPEDWGGKTPVIPVSAKNNKGIDDLLEMILLVSEIQELKTVFDIPATGIVIESHLSNNRGPVATVLIKSGTLKIGDSFVVGTTFGKVRAMLDDFGKKKTIAPPSFPVEILGISKTPNAGDVLQVLDNPKEIADKKRIEEKQQKFRKPITLETFSKDVKEQKNQKDLNVILKADVKGSLEAIISSLQKLNAENVGVQILHHSNGMVNESDVMLAVASNAIILAFGVSTKPEAERLAKLENIDIRNYNIIYNLIDDIQESLEGMLDPEYEEYQIGELEIRSLFKSSKAGVIAGCFVNKGKITRGSKIKVFRSQKEIYDGNVDSLKRFKEDTKEVKKGFECGVSVHNFNDFSEGDIIIVFETREKKREKVSRS